MLLSFVIGLVFILGLDYAWLKLVMRDLYISNFSSIMNLTQTGVGINLAAAVAAYILIYLGLWVFVLRHKYTSHLRCALHGAVYGFILYGVYDMTSLAIFKYWTWHVALVDMIWGAVLLGATALVVSCVRRANK